VIPLTIQSWRRFGVCGGHTGISLGLGQAVQQGGLHGPTLALESKLGDQQSSAHYWKYPQALVMASWDRKDHRATEMSERSVSMAGPSFESGQVSRILQQIYEGMAVLDQLGDKIGTVEYVYLGELPEIDEQFGQGQLAPSAADGSEGSLIEEFARAIVLTEQVPDIWRERLLSHGFIRINSTGLFTADRYVMPAQIASVADDRVMLCVSRDRLIKA
jgi:hypothetical protein